MRKLLLSFASLGAAFGVAVACGELTGPESPTTPTDVVATLASPTSVTVTWTPSPLNDGVISYSIYRNGDKVGETTGTEPTFTDTGLSPQTTYVYSVAANCVGGVVSARSVETEASTVTTRDVTAPTVIQVIPVEGATQVSPVANVNAIFSEPMDPASISSTTFTLRVTDGAPIAGTVTYNAETRRATLTPTSSLPNPVTLTATVTTGARDLAGNALAAAKSWVFTTRDDTPPTVVATSPVNGATGVPPTTQVTITFSEAMSVATVNSSNITIRDTGTGTVVPSVVTYDANTRVATLSPSASLSQSVNYTVTVSSGVTDTGGNAIGTFTFAFTVGDITSPTVTAVTPADGATAVAVATNVTATFSEAMDPATISTTTFTLRPTAGGSNIAATVTYNASNNTATLDPASNLAQGTSYTATVSTGVRDAAGNPMTAARTWSFTTADTTPPTVSSVEPANAAVGVATNATVRVTFSEPMDPATINTANITLRNTVTTALVPATVTYDGPTRVATLTPTGPLSNATNYTVGVTTGVRDVAGNALAAPFTSVFTTAAAPDNIAPTIVSRSPSPGATSVALSSDATVTFSEPMDPATINATTITLAPTASGTPVAATVTYNAATNTATLDPATDLASSTSYTLTITTGVTDVAGNALAVQSTSTFTTVDTTPPAVSSVEPANAAVDVATNTTVRVTFSEPMDPATINTANITLRNTITTALVPATVTYDGPTRVATLTPTGPLSNATNYTVGVTTGVRDAAGNALAAPFTSVFTTAAAPDNTAPTIVSRAPANGATGIKVDTVVTVTFSEPMNAATINGTNITLRHTASNGLVAATVTYNAATNTATLDPTNSLGNDSSYTITVTTGVTDVAGNALAAESTSTFTTIQDTTAPTVTSRTPTATTGVPANTVVTVTFSEAMDALTINGTTFTLARIPETGPPEAVTGAVTYNSATRVATFTPSANLTAGASYTATVTTGAKDLAENALIANFTFSFAVAP